MINWFSTLESNTPVSVMVHGTYASDVYNHKSGLKVTYNNKGELIYYRVPPRNNTFDCVESLVSIYDILFIDYECYTGSP